MAGLQYNFFPTDFYYPRLQSTVPAADTGRAAAVIIKTKTPNKEVGDELEWPKSLGFRVRQAGSSKQQGGVSMSIQHQNQGKAYVENQGKLVNYSSNQVSWFTLIPEELSDSS
ncbi:hypothetical protein COLO4_21281 [Corchorus olitorius]|uniref:Uncharacterized protein n=1 Tax=Corchorus olitorius TaxID=93759 RepID=A0A1R3IUC3_9ROSI|nr:hypothetical protein COLO4_21281 [Corchorus olitorius]